MPSHIFIGDFCIFCGEEDETLPCKDPSNFADCVLWETKYWMAEHGWNGVEAVRWHELTTHIAGRIYEALHAVKHGADQVTFNWPGGARTEYIDSFMIPGVVSRLLLERHNKINIDILPNNRVRTTMVIATMLFQNRQEMRFNQPFTLTADAIAKGLKRRVSTARS